MLPAVQNIPIGSIDGAPALRSRGHARPFSLKGKAMALKRALLTILFFVVFSTLAVAQENLSFPVGASSKVLGFAPLWVASGKEFLKRQGLDAEVTAIRGTAPTMQALVSNSIYVALAANDGVIGLAEKGMDVAMIAAGSKTTHMIMAAKKFKTYEDLRGATIGSSTLTSGTAFLLKRVLKTRGLEYPRDYTLVNVGGSGPAFTALSAGRIDAAILAVPINFRAQELGFNLIGKVTDVFPNYLLSSFSVRRQWAAEHRQEVVRFLKAVLEARKWLEDNKKAGAEFLAKELEMKPKLAERGLDYYLTHGAWEPNLNIDLDGLKTVVEIYAEQTEMKGSIPSPEKYVDLSYLQQALKELGWK
jgi:NitT/TauT family transport system substrate-binding protein